MTAHRPRVSVPDEDGRPRTSISKRDLQGHRKGRFVVLSDTVMGILLSGTTGGGMVMAWEIPWRGGRGKTTRQSQTGCDEKKIQSERRNTIKYKEMIQSDICICLFTDLSI